MTVAQVFEKRFGVDPKITYAQISERAGVPLSTVHAIAIGKHLDPRISTITKIEFALEALLRERMKTKGGCRMK